MWSVHTHTSSRVPNNNNNHNHNNKNTSSLHSSVALVFVRPFFVMDFTWSLRDSDEHAAGAAVDDRRDGPGRRGPKMARAGEEGHEEYDAPRRLKNPPPQPELFKLFAEEPGGVRPEVLAEPRPQERAQRHTMEQLADVAPMVPSLAVPEPQMVDQLVAMIKLVDSVVPEQIIAVPKISWPSRFPRTVLREPQKAEQPTGSRVIRGLVASNGASPPAQGGK